MKYFTKEVKIGLTGIIAIAVLFLGLNFLKGINLFKSTNSYYISFSDAKGLTQSSPVYANGYNIGIVREIIYDYTNPGNVLVVIDADEQLRIGKGTSANLVTEMLGGCTLHLNLAANTTEYYQPGDTIKGNDSNGLMEKAETSGPLDLFYLQWLPGPFHGMKLIKSSFISKSLNVMYKFLHRFHKS